MSGSKKAIMLLCSFMLVVSVSACKKEGPAERAGKSIDQAMDKAGKKIEQTTEKAGDTIEDAGKKLKDSVK